MALTTINTLTTTDLTSKHKIISIVAFSVAGGTVVVNDGTGGTTRYKIVLGANQQFAVAFPGPKFPIMPAGLSVITSGTDIILTLDLE